MILTGKWKRIAYKTQCHRFALWFNVEDIGVVFIVEVGGYVIIDRDRHTCNFSLWLFLWVEVEREKKKERGRVR